MKLKNKVAIVTGASRGIGRIIALTMAREGAQVTVTARTKTQLDELVAQITEEGGEALAVEASVSNEDEVKHIIDQTMEKFGTINILVNNAGIGSFTEVVDFPYNQFMDMIETNLIGVFLMYKVVQPVMLESELPTPKGEGFVY